ncbi:heme exporter protein CcmB [Candidatus Mycalebacterium sp.]
MRDIWTVFLKDISIETSGGGVFPAVAAFAVVIASVLHFTNVFPSAPAAAKAAPAVFWISTLFAATIAFERSFEVERKSEAIRTVLMSPVDRSAVFIGKTLANLLLLTAVQVVFIPVFALFFSLDILPVLAPFAVAVFTGTVGVAAVGTALSALSAQTGMKGAIFPVLLFPLLIPVLISASESLSAVLGGVPAGDLLRHMKVLISFDFAFLAAGALVYGYIIEDV